VEVLDSAEKLKGLKFSSESDSLGVGVVDADGKKCDRCWNYSTFVGQDGEHPAICERCVDALSDKF
jgi:isoleucyl-tRNA synthetase